MHTQNAYILSMGFFSHGKDFIAFLKYGNERTYKTEPTAERWQKIQNLLGNTHVSDLWLCNNTKYAQLKFISSYLHCQFYVSLDTFSYLENNIYWFLESTFNFFPLMVESIWQVMS